MTSCCKIGWMENLQIFEEANKRYDLQQLVK